MLAAIALSLASADPPVTAEQAMANARLLTSVAPPRCRPSVDDAKITVCARRLADTQRLPLPDEARIIPPSSPLDTPSEAQRTCGGPCTGSIGKVISGLLGALRGD